MMKLKIFALALVTLFSMNSAALAISLVDADWLKKNMNNKNVKIMDVADKPNAFDKEHIPGAIQVKRYLDLSNTDRYPATAYPTKAQFQKFLSESGIENGSVIVAYDDKSSLFATRLLFLLEMFGHDPAKLKLLNGGIVNWKKQGNKLTDDITKIKPSKYKITKVKSNLTVTWSDIYRDAVQGIKPEVLLLDSRTEGEFKAKNIRAIRGGYLPKAVLVTSSDANEKDSQLFKSIDDIKKLYEAKDVNSERIIYTYCHSGDRSAHTYVILKYMLGYKNVKVYEGGWVEWANMVALPLAGQIWLWDAPKPEKKEEPKK